MSSRTISTSGIAWLTRWTSMASPKLAVTTRLVAEVVAGPAQDVERVGSPRTRPTPARGRRCRRQRSRASVKHNSRVIRSRMSEISVGGDTRRGRWLRGSPTRCALDLHGVAVLVVGAGPVAARKVAGLAAAGARRPRRRPDVSAAMAGGGRRGDVDTLDAAPVRAGRPRRRPARRHGTGDRRRPRRRRRGDRGRASGSTPPIARTTARSSSRRSPATAR